MCLLSCDGEILNTTIYILSANTNMEGKKISFGFMKTKKVGKPVVEEKKEYIECVEEKSIKVVDGEIAKEVVPLVIPLKPNTLITAERLKEIAEKVEGDLEGPENNDSSNVIDSSIKLQNETLDQMAVRELLEESKKQVKVETSHLTVPVPSKIVIDGQKESTLDDYESVPIQEFGMAMLRGMGWTPNKDQLKYKQPELRPKGMGLGADKVIKKKQNKNIAKDSNGDELTIVKNAYVKITTGKYSGCYGKILSLDEENGRVMIDIPIKKETISLSEFMMHPVTKAEFDKESKVINADTFEQYKKIEKMKQISLKQDGASSSQKSGDNKTEKSNKIREDSNGRSRTRHRKKSSSSEDSLKRDLKKYSSNESLSSLSDSDRRKKHKKSRRRSSSSSSDHKSSRRRKSRTPKRDIDKKRKGKKKKRDRDRSPNHRKHKK